jgi:hypothetical protein
VDSQLRASNEGLLRPRVARAQRAVWLTCFPRAFGAPPNFSSNKTLKSMRLNQAMSRGRLGSRGEELVLSGAEQRNKPFLFEMPICRQCL